MGRIARSLVFLTGAAGTTWVVRARRRADETHQTLIDVMKVDLRTFVTHRFDPVVMRLGLAGGRVSPWAVLEHVGRTSGSIHRTPVYSEVRDDMAFIPLPYGPEVQWLKNVLAEGHCRLQQHEVLFELDEPTIVGAPENATLSRAGHRVMDGTGAQYLRLHVLDRAPGTFTYPAAEFTTHRAAADHPDIRSAHPEAERAPKASVTSGA